jgi:hypothetical protein
MRAILFCCSLMMFSCTVALAQKAQTKVAQAPDAKTLFVSNINKFDASAIRGTTETVNKTYDELINAMEMQVHADKEKAKSLSGQERKAINDKIAEEIRVVRDAAMLGREDKLKNREAIKAKMESFLPYF